MEYREIAKKLALELCLEFDPELLVPQERIRALCCQDKCGNYGKNYMCPPFVGSLGEIGARLKGFKKGLLLRYSEAMEVRGNREGALNSMINFHLRVLSMERRLEEMGVRRLWGLVGGTCGLCDVCKARSNEPCPYPNFARMSLEAIAVDVMALLDKFGLDNRFHAGRITWTGCILFNEKG